MEGSRPGQPTSIRPPLYPALVAAIFAVAGESNYQAVRLVQFVLALLTTALVYRLGCRIFTPAVGRYAAAATWLYPSIVFFNFTILTETLYIFLLLAFVLAAVRLIAAPTPGTAVWCGVALGLIDAREVHARGQFLKEGGSVAMDRFFHQVSRPRRAESASSHKE